MTAFLRVWLALVRLDWLTGHDGRPAFWKLVLLVLIVWTLRYVKPELSWTYMALLAEVAALTYGWKGMQLLGSWVLAKINAPKGEP